MMVEIEHCKKCNAIISVHNFVRFSNAMNDLRKTRGYDPVPTTSDSYRKKLCLKCFEEGEN